MDITDTEAEILALLEDWFPEALRMLEVIIEKIQSIDDPDEIELRIRRGWAKLY